MGMGARVRLNVSFRSLAIKVLKPLVYIYPKLATQLAINVGYVVQYVNTSSLKLAGSHELLVQ